MSTPIVPRSLQVCLRICDYDNVVVNEGGSWFDDDILKTNLLTLSCDPRACLATGAMGKPQTLKRVPIVKHENQPPPLIFSLLPFLSFVTQVDANAIDISLMYGLPLVGKPTIGSSSVDEHRSMTLLLGQVRARYFALLFFGYSYFLFNVLLSLFFSSAATSRTRPRASFFAPPLPIRSRLCTTSSSSFRRSP